MKTRIKHQPNQYAVRLTQLREKIDYTYVKVLNLSSLQLKSLEIQLHSLETLILDFNHLEKIDIERHFSNLITLSIVDNQLSEFFVPATLRILNIKGNLLTAINVQNLEQLDVSQNKLNTIQQNNSCLQKFKVGWLLVINQNEQLELLTFKQLSLEIIYFKDFLAEAIQLLMISGFKKESIIEYFDPSIFHFCIETNNLYYFEQLLPWYIENKAYFTNETPLCLAIKKMKLEFITLLMQTLPIQQEIQAFHEAIKQGQVSLVKQFLEMGVDSNAYSNKGWTPLTTAALNITQINMEMIVHLLIQSKGNPNRLNRNGLSLIQMCIIKSNLSALRFILNINKKRNNFIKFKMNIKGSNGDYPLHTAVQSVSITQFLLYNQIGNALSVNYQNMTAKQMAVYQDRTVIYKLLQKEEKKIISKQIMKQYSIFTDVKGDNSSSSCPELSDDEMPNKPKINKKYLTEMDELSFDVLQQSEDDECQHNCSSESGIQWPRENLRSLKLQQLNHQNVIFNRSQGHARSKSIMLNKLNKRRLTYEQFQYFIRDGQSEKERNISIYHLRSELFLFGQVVVYKDALLSFSDEYVKCLNEQINKLECELENTELRQYLNFQSILYLQ